MAKYKPYQLRLPPEHIERMAEIAEATDVPVAQIYRHAIHAWLASRYPHGPENDRPNVVSGILPPETLGVPNGVLRAHADTMEQALGTRPDTVRRGDREAPMPGFSPSDLIDSRNVHPAEKREQLAKRHVTPIPKKRGK